MKFWKSNFFQLIASQIQQKLLKSKLSRLWTFAVIGFFAWAKIRALKLLILRKNVSITTFLQKNVSLKKTHTLIILAMPNGSTIFYAKRCDTSYISIYQKACSFLAVSFIIFE